MREMSICNDQLKTSIDRRIYSLPEFKQTQTLLLISQIVDVLTVTKDHSDHEKELYEGSEDQDKLIQDLTDRVCSLCPYKEKCENEEMECIYNN